MSKVTRLLKLLTKLTATALINGIFTSNARRRTVMEWRLRDVQHGKRVISGSNVTILNRKNLRLGSDVMLTNNIVISSAAPVVIGDKVMIGPGTLIHTTSHDLVSKVAIHKPIIIHDGVWIAASATITSGVTIGPNSVVAAGAVVVNDIPAGVVAGGVPAKVIKTIGDDITKHTRFTQLEWIKRFQ